jgi:peptide/nickel transport system ATP-binding protein
MSEPAPILALDNVTKVFHRAGGTVHAARSISFALHPGRTLALVGESGSGKTTAARLIMREYRPDEGRLLFRGAPVEGGPLGSLRAYRSAVQMVFQDPFSSLNPVHTVRYHIERRCGSISPPSRAPSGRRRSPRSSPGSSSTRH